MPMMPYDHQESNRAKSQVSISFSDTNGVGEVFPAQAIYPWCINRWHRIMMIVIDALVFLSHSMDFPEESNLFDTDWSTGLPSVTSVDCNHDRLFQHNKFLSVLNQLQNDDRVVAPVGNALSLHPVEPIQTNIYHTDHLIQSLTKCGKNLANGERNRALI